MHRRPLGRGRTLAIPAGILIVVGCVLQWWQVGGTPGIPQHAENGLPGSGIVVFLVGIVVLALVALPSAIQQGSVLSLVTWVSQTFIQLVMLSVIMVGQAIMSKASDKRAEMTYKDAEATFHEAEQIQRHLQAQDDALNSLLDKIAKLEEALAAKS